METPSKNCFWIVSVNVMDGALAALKLSVFDCEATKPCEHPLPHGLSTLAGFPMKLATGVTHTLYTSPWFGVLRKSVGQFELAKPIVIAPSSGWS